MAQMVRINRNEDLSNFVIIPNHENVVRIATIGEGSCFFHGILNSIYPKYQALGTVSERIKMVRNLRIELAEYINQPEVYESLDGINDMAKHEVNYTKANLVERISDNSISVGDEVYKLTSDLFQINIVIINQIGNYVIDIGDDFDKTVIIAHVGNHYENVAFLTPDGLITLFNKNSDRFNEFLAISKS